MSLVPSQINRTLAQTRSFLLAFFDKVCLSKGAGCRDLLAVHTRTQFDWWIVMERMQCTCLHNFMRRVSVEFPARTKATIDLNFLKLMRSAPCQRIDSMKREFQDFLAFCSEFKQHNIGGMKNCTYLHIPPSLLSLFIRLLGRGLDRWRTFRILPDGYHRRVFSSLDLLSLSDLREDSLIRYIYAYRCEIRSIYVQIGCKSAR